MKGEAITGGGSDEVGPGKEVETRPEMAVDQ